MHGSALRPGLSAYPLTEATAPALEALQGGRTLPDEAIPPAAVPPGVYQPWLFRDPSQGPKVVPIPTLTPRPHGGERKHRVQTTARTQGPRGSAAAQRAADSQQSLEFHTSVVSEQSRRTEVEAVIYCDVPVAVPIHRLMAVAADGSMIAIALGLFLAIFYLSGGRIVFTKASVMLLLGVIGAVVFLYRLLWCLGGGDTPGMRFAGLRLVDFDGCRPKREQRTIRLAASVLSLVSAGLGLLWALVDEESLTWHDHISKTFPTPG